MLMLRCALCGLESRDVDVGREACPACGGYWELPFASRVTVAEDTRRPGGLRNFSSSLSVPAESAESAVLSLGEGNTPLVRLHPTGTGAVGSLDRTGAMGSLDRAEVFIKNETANPTGSFKDRFAYANTAAARASGARGIVCASTGNQGLATATYAAVHGLDCAVFLPRSTPRTFLHCLKLTGAAVRFCAWEERLSSVVALVRRGWFPATGLTAFPAATQFGAEGYKTIAYEIVRDMSPDMPEFIAVPVGGGDLLYGVVKGLLEMARLGVAKGAPPRVLACQAEGACPLVNAYLRGLARVEPLACATSIAASINESHCGSHALEALRSVNGLAVSVTDGLIVAAAVALARSGILAELASAAAVAGAAEAVRSGLVPEGSKIVCVVTGSVVKWGRTLARLSREGACRDRGL